MPTIVVNNTCGEVSTYDLAHLFSNFVCVQRLTPIDIDSDLLGEFEYLIDASTWVERSETWHMFTGWRVQIMHSLSDR